jgi:zinc transport system ATP-binding protein
VRILDAINLHMHCGELTAVIGPNGAGKTTLLKAMLGEAPHGGTLRFIHQGNVESARPLRIGYVPQTLELDRTAPTTVLDLFASARSRRPLWMGISERARAEAAEALATVGAEPLLDRRLAALSSGQLQRVLLALALTPTPELLLLDEPLTGLDPAGMALFYQTVSQLRDRFDLSILLVSHDLAAVARVADRMILLNRTVLRDGPPREVLLDPLIRRTFGFGFTEAELRPGRPAPAGAPHARCPLPVGRRS